MSYPKKNWIRFAEFRERDPVDFVIGTRFHHREPLVQSYTKRSHIGFQFTTGGDDGRKENECGKTGGLIESLRYCLTRFRLILVKQTLQESVGVSIISLCR